MTILPAPSFFAYSPNRWMRPVGWWADDPELFEFWYEYTLEDSLENRDEWEESLGQTALSVLVEQYPDHPKTLELLKDRAQNDNDPQLKEWAIQQLAKLSGEV